MDEFTAMRTRHRNDAILNNYTNIMALLLADKSCSHDHTDSSLPRPLFLAMRTGNLSIVEDILKAGASVNVYGALLPCYTTDVTLGGLYVSSIFNRSSLSAVEYACCLDNPEMLQLIARYDNAGNQDGAALFTIIDLLQCYWTNFPDGSEKRFELPKFVRALIDAGVSVNVLDDNGKSPLHCLLKSVLIVLKDFVHIDSEHFQMIVDTVQMLLEAGALTNLSQSYLLMHAVLDIIFAYCTNKMNLLVSFPDSQLPAIMEILKLLLIHRLTLAHAQWLQPLHMQDTLHCILHIFMKLSKIIVEAKSIQNNSNIFPVLGDFEFNEILEGAAEAFHLLLLAGPSFNLATYSRSNLLDFYSAFFVFVRYSSKFDLVQKLLGFVANVTSYAELFQFQKWVLNKAYESASIADLITPQEEEEVVKFLCVINTPRSLLHLSRDRIIRCLWSRRLLLSGGHEVLSSLKIPMSLHRYVLLQDD